MNYEEMEMNESLNEAYAEKTKRDYDKRKEGKRKEELKKAKMAARSGKKHSHRRVRDYEYDEFNDVDLRRYFLGEEGNFLVSLFYVGEK